MIANIAVPILIIENNEQVGKIMARALMMGANYQYQVDICTDHTQILPMMEKKSYQLVFCKQNLFPKSGIEILAELKRVYPLSRFILLFDKPLLDEIKFQVIQVVDDYLVGPFSMLSLVRLAEKHLEADNLLKKSLSKQIPEGIGRKVLIIEDDLSLQKFYKLAFEKHNYRIYLAGNIEESRKAIGSTKFDILICDVHLGRENGYDILKEMNVKLKNDNTKIIIVSGDNQYRYLMKDVGAEFFLEKPVSFLTLLTLIERLIDNKNQQNSKLNEVDENLIDFDDMLIKSNQETRMTHHSE